MATAWRGRCMLTLSLFLLDLLPFGYSTPVFDLKRCRRCSSRVDVPCYIESMGDNCLHGVTQDLLQDGHNWPGPVRDFQAVTILREGTQYANFTWKPPYDSSIETLRGFEIHLAWHGYSSLGNHCFFANLTNRNWTKVKDKYNVVFHFDCIQSAKALVINAYINSTPKPTQNISRRNISHRMNDIPIWWPSLHYYIQETSHNRSMLVVFNKMFEGAEYHEILMVEEVLFGRFAGHKTLNSVLLKVPNQNVTFYNVPCDRNVSLWIRPLDSHKQELHHYEAFHDIYTKDCPQAVAVLDSPTSVSNIGAYICVPIILIVVTIATSVFYFRKDKLKFCQWTGMIPNNYQPTAQTDISPNNINSGNSENTAKTEVMVVPVYFQENRHLVSVVQTLRKLFQKIHGSKVRMLSDESARMLCDDWLCQNSPYEVLVIFTHSLSTVYEATQSGLCSDVNHIKNCISALRTIEKVSGNGNNFKQPHFLSIFSEVDDPFLCRFTAPDTLRKRSVYILSDVTVEGQESDKNCVFRKEDVSSLIQDIQGDKDKKEEISFSGTDITDIEEIQRHLLHYYTLAERKSVFHNGTSSCAMDKRKKDSSKVKVAMEPMVQFSHNRSGGQTRIINSLSNDCHASPISPVLSKMIEFHQNGDVQSENLQNLMLDKRGLYGRNKFDRRRYECKTEEERPCMMENSCFIPPSDSESLDNISLCQEMLEINQRNLPAYSS